MSKWNEKEEVESLKAFCKRNPVTANIFFAFCGIVLIAGLYSTLTYTPPAPQPTITIWGFFDFLNHVQLPAIGWIVVFGMLWITKWW